MRHLNEHWKVCSDSDGKFYIKSEPTGWNVVEAIESLLEDDDGKETLEYICGLHNAGLVETKDTKRLDNKNLPDKTTFNCFLEQLQAHIVVAGGRISIEELKKYSFEDIIKTLWMNGIELSARFSNEFIQQYNKE